MARPMMTPEDVLLDAIKAADMMGDTLAIRREFCAKLKVSLENCEMHGIRWRTMLTQRDDGQHEKD